MDIKKLVLGPFSVNCYLITSENAAIVADPGCYSSDIVDFLNKHKDKERLILITHAHFDHIGGAKKLSEATGVKIGIGLKDGKALSEPDINLSNRFGVYAEPFEADYRYSDGEIFSVGDLSVKTIETPGHTVGSVCYLINGNLFCGDTLFYESYGRTDFPGGDDEQMKESFFKIITELDDDINVFPGHGTPTTVRHEKEYNPLGFVSAI